MPPRKSTQDLEFTLRRVFHKPSFRPLQREIILAALANHDVFVQAATSFGKSLCYQLPAVVNHGVTICISPLLSLMKNQVEALEAANVPVACLNSRTTYEEKNKIFVDLECGHPRTRLLYVTPEMCQSERFRRALMNTYKQKELARIAVDEAHCISEWGHDFRSSYLQLRFFRETFPRTPIICLTATATKDVREDVIATLGLDPNTIKIFSTTTFRPNLHFEVQFYSDEEDRRVEYIVAWIKQIHARRGDDAERRAELEAKGERPNGVSGIIYASFRNDCDALAARLRERGLGAKPYHAGMEPNQRFENQTKWVLNEPGFEIIVATTAFGMGIDKDDVRFVIHYNISKSFEGFYQEAGRAGRDGRASICMQFYSREDAERARNRISKEVGLQPTPARIAQVKTKLKSFDKVVEYCESTLKCRHEMILDYFPKSEEASRASQGDNAVCDYACDWCKDKKDLRSRKSNSLATEEWVSTQRDTGALFPNSDDTYD